MLRIKSKLFHFRAQALNFDEVGLALKELSDDGTAGINERYFCHPLSAIQLSIAGTFKSIEAGVGDGREVMRFCAVDEVFFAFATTAAPALEGVGCVLRQVIQIRKMVQNFNFCGILRQPGHFNGVVSRSKVVAIHRGLEVEQFDVVLEAAEQDEKGRQHIHH